MLRQISSWSNTLTKLGFKISSKNSRKRVGHRSHFTRHPRIEQLEERLNFSTGAQLLFQVPTVAQPCGCNCSPASLTIYNGLTTLAGMMMYCSLTDPEGSASMEIQEPLSNLLAQNADNFRVDVTIGGQTKSYFWKAGPESNYQADGADFEGLISADFDFGDLPTGVYNWHVETSVFDAYGVPIGETYVMDQDNPGVGEYISTKTTYIRVVNRTNSPFGNGWSIPGVDQLFIQPGSEYQPKGVALLTSDDALVWFKEVDDEGMPPVFTREDNPYNFSQLTLDGSDYILTDADGTKHIFDSAGLLTSVEDRFGNVLDSYSYDGDDPDSKLTMITERPYLNARSTKFQYNEDGLIESITDFWNVGEDEPTAGVSQTTTYSYTKDLSGNVTQMQMAEPDPDGDGEGNSLTSPVTTYNYDENHRISSIVDPRGLETDIWYDEAGLVQEIKQRCGGEIDIRSLESQSIGSQAVDPAGGLWEMIESR